MYSKSNYNLAFGSSLRWIVQGGTNFWKDIKEKYLVKEIITIINEDKKNIDKEILRFSYERESTNEFEYQITCIAPKDKYYQMTKSMFFGVIVRQEN